MRPQILGQQDPNFQPCLAAHHVGKFGEVIPTGPKIIHPNMLTVGQCLNFCFRTFFGGTQIFWT